MCLRALKYILFVGSTINLPPLLYQGLGFLLIAVSLSTQTGIILIKTTGINRCPVNS